MHPLTPLPDPVIDLMPQLRRRARRLSAHQSDTDDLLQDTVLTLWKMHARGEHPDDPMRYAMTVMTNLARKRWRTRLPSDPLEDDMAQTGPDAPLRIACTELRRAIGRLPDPQRRVMELVAAGETSPADIAALTGLPLGTVMSRLARARATLRADLGLQQRESVAQLY